MLRTSGWYTNGTIFDPTCVTRVFAKGTFVFHQFGTPNNTLSSKYQGSGTFYMEPEQMKYIMFKRSGSYRQSFQMKYDVNFFRD